MFRLLLYLFPASWRAEYGREMCDIFRRRKQEAGGFLGVLLLWLDTLPDLISSAAAAQWDVLRQDLRYACRAFAHSPGFAATAVLVTALGVGATTAAVSLVDHVLIRPLPFPSPDRLVKLRETDPQSTSWNEMSPANYRDWKRMSSSFDSMGAYRWLSVNLTGGGSEPRRIEGASFTADVFATVGIPPLMGRWFAAEDDRDSAPATVLLSYGLWQEQFAGDPSILGRSIELDGAAHRVIGIMPRDFFFPTRETRLWTAMRWSANSFEDRRDTYITPVARLKPGVAAEEARAEALTIAAQLRRQYPADFIRVSFGLVRLRDEVSNRSRVMLKTLLGAALCLLLIACTNLGNLLMARAIARRRELAVRTALGAGRERLLRQMLTESLLLSGAGGALGVLVARSAVPLLVRLVPITLPIAEAPGLDGRVLMVALVSTLATGVAFGILPAARAGLAGLNEGGRSGIGARRERLRSALVVLQVAGSIVLLAGFGLLTRALWRVQSIDPGFRADHVLTMRTSLPMPRYEERDTRAAFYRRVLDGAARLPGVIGAAYTSFLPIAHGGGIWLVEIPGRPQSPSERRGASLRFVTPDYFAAMGIPLLRGRPIRDTDTREAPKVAVVSRSLARRYFPDQDPLGRRITFGAADRTIVGVVGDVETRGVESHSEPQVYLPPDQCDNVSTWYAPKDLVVRTNGDASALAPMLRQIIRAADPSQPISDVRTLEDVVAGETAPRRAQLAVLGGFGGLAFLLAGVGIHGLLAFAVSTRTQEIGVRMALGATRLDILGLTLGDAFRLAAVGSGAGLAMALAGGRLLQSMLAGVAPSDPATFGAAIALAFVMTLAGGLVPAMRAARVDPTVAMRAE